MVRCLVCAAFMLPPVQEQWQLITLPVCNWCCHNYTDTVAEYWKPHVTASRPPGWVSFLAYAHIPEVLYVGTHEVGRVLKSLVPPGVYQTVWHPGAADIVKEKFSIEPDDTRIGVSRRLLVVQPGPSATVDQIRWHGHLVHGYQSAQWGNCVIAYRELTRSMGRPTDTPRVTTVDKLCQWLLEEHGIQAERPTKSFDEAVEEFCNAPESVLAVR